MEHAGLIARPSRRPGASGNMSRHWISVTMVVFFPGTTPGSPGTATYSTVRMAPGETCSVSGHA